MAKLTWDALSEEIKALIIDEVLRPTDLRNVCLVNKQCHALAVKPLYRYIELDVGSNKDGNLTAAFSPRNIGVPHIRSIHLYLADEHYRDKREHLIEQAHLVTRMILELLPEDILERFSWCPWKAFRTENLLLLFKRQRKLKNLDVIRLDKDILPALEKNGRLQEAMFARAKRLYLYPEDRASIQLSGFCVRKMAEKLEDLTIHTNFNDGRDHFEDPLDDLPEHIEPRELNDSTTEPGLLTRTVFGHQMPFDKCEPFTNLTSLSLRRVNVRQAADTWCNVIDFTRIEYVHLYMCTGADALLGQLSKAAHLPKQLKAFSLSHHDNAEQETLMAVDGFLCLVSGIRDLILDFMHAKELPARAGIARHGKTLETLNVHAWKESCMSRPSSPLPTSSSLPTVGEEFVYKIEDLQHICNACKLLTQLSIAFPGRAITYQPQANSDLGIYEGNIVSRLRHLVTLNISSWPLNSISSSSSPVPSQTLPRSTYETLLQSVALRLFNLAAYWSTKPPSQPATAEEFPSPIALPSSWTFTTPATPKLRLIAFGVSDRTYERQNTKMQIIYLRSTCRDAEARTKLHATPISWTLKQYVEPVSDVLNTSLLRVPSPPFPVPEVRVRGLSWDPEDDDIVDD